MDLISWYGIVLVIIMVANNNLKNSNVIVGMHMHAVYCGKYKQLQAGKKEEKKKGKKDAQKPELK